ncbi:ImmA/IrrE family metallo-endopeptidase [Variovorax sp. VNK109]|uniref:ImmA/IrrE family metallo-endopeptidase n=1 Tax=Variovorax sp. VNK109 TaxID=3400919 RepID=UPI003C08121A
MLAITPINASGIEDDARQLQTELWDQQCKYWPGQNVLHLDVCDPWIAAEHLGFTVQEGYVTSPGTRPGFQLGGFINRPARFIGVSDQQIPRTQRFTLAHEVGHLRLHPNLHMHRELPLKGLNEPGVRTERVEIEANIFAGCFLVPRKHLRRAFIAAFGVEQLALTDNVAYELLGSNFMSLMNSSYDSLAFERVVATALRFRGRQFDSLNNLFDVSPTTLAIRLRECGLTCR